MKLKTTLVTVATLVSTVALSPARSLAGDTEYLGTLASLGSRIPAPVQAIVTQMGDANNINMAKNMCTVLDKPEVSTVEDLMKSVIDQNFFGLIPTPDNRQRAEAVGGYIALTTLAGTPQYCSQHGPKVRQMFGF